MVKPCRVSMTSYVNDIYTAIKNIGQPCAVIGHSMGGIVISAAAEKYPELFTRLIYLTALAPRKNGTCMVGHDIKHPNKKLTGAMRVSPLSLTATISPKVATEIFYNTCSEDVQVEAVTKLCPQPLRPTIRKVVWSEQRLGSIPKDYIECTLDKAVPIGVQRTLQGNMAFSNVISLECDHSPFLSMPEKLAASIFELLAE